MNSARIERMTRELNAEPATHLFEQLASLFELFTTGTVTTGAVTPAKVTAPAQSRLSLE